MHVNSKLTHFILVNSDDKSECSTSFLNDGEMLVIQILLHQVRILQTISSDMCTQQQPQTLPMTAQRTALSSIPQIIISAHKRTSNKFCFSNSFMHILKTILFFYKFSKNTVSAEMKLPQQSRSSPFQYLLLSTPSALLFTFLFISSLKQTQN